jgi:dTDP-D-glucose 4,6-dehydratase
LAALPVIAGGNNNLPTIHVRDLANSIETILMEGTNFNQYLIAVDDSFDQTQREFMLDISEGIGSGAVNDITIGEAIE